MEPYNCTVAQERVIVPEATAVKEFRSRSSYYLI